MTVGNGVNVTGDDKSYLYVTKFSFLILSLIQRSSQKSLYLWWILLDSQSTENVFCNQKTAQDI